MNTPTNATGSDVLAEAYGSTFVSLGSEGRCLILKDWRGREIYLMRDEALALLAALPEAINQMPVSITSNGRTEARGEAPLPPVSC